MLALCAPGRALELKAVMQRAVLFAVRRQVRRDDHLCAVGASLQQSVQTPRDRGPVGRPWQAVRQLKWRWPSVGIVQDD